ncbi:MAG: FAD-dependent oxidoreductase [Sedimentisphaerales bacterium]|nr:FAD-dependent oxidoreductase [Sedimentisphaerales bacterium]
MWEFSLNSIEDLKRLSDKLGLSVQVQEDVSILARPVQAGKLNIPNSLAIHPMEGCDGDLQGTPGQLTLRRYRRFAAGGAGLLWSEATAVVPEGRANPRQLWINENNVSDFAAMVSMMRQVASESMGPNHKPVIVMQLTHSGRYSKPEGRPHPIIPQRDSYRDALTPQETPEPKRESKIPNDWPLVTDEYLDNLKNAYVNAARLAFKAGFDAVDIKSCHGYLINELFACYNRKGKYGGSFENRTRFLLETIDKIRKELGDKAVITTRLGIYDAIPYPYGWGVDKKDYTKPDLREPTELIKLLHDRGVNLLNITLANPYYNPHIGRPFNEAIVGGYKEPEHPLTGVNRLFNLTGQIQKQFHDMVIIGAGYSWLRTLFANAAATNISNGLVTLAGVGRMAFAYPDFAKDIIQKGKMKPEKVCVGCSACTQIMRDGGMAGCVVRDSKVYGPIFEHGRMSSRENLARLASNCRMCQEPSCQLACPAGIDIPQFISLFLENKDKQAYEVIRKSNIFPEVCAWLCPVEQQCQGNCLQSFIGDGPLPIADIQRYLAEQANKNGWSKLRIPEKSTGKHIAVIGAGPAGLSCAAKLLEAGHNVTIFDKNAELGGTIDSVIPAERQSDSLKNEIKAVFADVPKDRLNLRLGTELNREFNLDNIIEEKFDAVFIGMGLPKAFGINEEDKKISGLWNAMDFLSAAKDGNKPDIEGKSVAVIGGGNTAMDAAVTAKYLGAKDVYILYRRSFIEMPAWQAERDRAIKEGIHFLVLTQPLKFNSSKGKLKSITVCPTRLEEPDSSGRRKPVPIESSAYDLDMDAAIEAIGQKQVEEIKEILPGVELYKGLIKTRKQSFAATREKVFAGGDLVRGASTVVAAVADGMKAAIEINEYLTK